MNGRAGFGVLARRVPRRSAALRFGREVGLDHSPSNALDFEIEDYASTCPFFYGSEESPDLLRSIERQYLDPGHEIDRWARQFLRRQGPTGTRELLAAMTHAIKERFTYVSRHGYRSSRRRGRRAARCASPVHSNATASRAPEWLMAEPDGPGIAAFAPYEAALVSNDVATLDGLFWNASHTVRYGITEDLYGYGAIQAFRAARSPVGPARSLQHTVITTFGRDFATASTEFRRIGSDRIGRQTQSWVRFAEGWRVVAAHVSVLM